MEVTLVLVMHFIFTMPGAVAKCHKGASLKEILDKEQETLKLAPHN